MLEFGHLPQSLSNFLDARSFTEPRAHPFWLTSSLMVSMPCLHLPAFGISGHCYTHPTLSGLGIWTFSGPASCVASTLPAVPSAQSRYSFVCVKVPHLPDSACHSPLCKGLLSLLLVPMPDALLWFFVADYCCDFCGFACLVYSVLY